jgi:hypothetical protein
MTKTRKCDTGSLSHSSRDLDLGERRYPPRAADPSTTTNALLPCSRFATGSCSGRFSVRDRPVARRPRRSWSLSPQADVGNIRPDPLIAGREPCILGNRYAIDSKEMVDRDVTFNAFDDRE